MRVVVIGASEGIGAALVRRLSASGHVVVAVARSGDKLAALASSCGPGAVHPLVHDVQQVEAAPTAFADAVERLGGVDAVVYNAGVMPDVQLDEYDIAKDRLTIEVNVIGAMAWLNEAARTFAKLGRGVIVGVGSVAGDRGRLGNPAYCASKAAIHSYLESLRNRLDRQGVRVVTIKPGPVKTRMTEGRDKLPMLIDADVAAAAIEASLTAGPLTRYVPWTWWPIMTVIRHIPSLVFRRLNV